MSSHDHKYSLLRPGIAQTLGGVAIGAAAVLLTQRWLAARARRKPAKAVVVPAAKALVEVPAPARRARKRARRA